MHSLMWKLTMGKILIRNFRVIVIHVGTNDLDSDPDSIMRNFRKLVQELKAHNQTACVAISGIYKGRHRLSL